MLVTFLMLRNTRRRLADPGHSPQAYAREQVARLKDQHDMKGDMEQLLVQLQELSRQINAQVDTKFAKLEVSMMAADERIAALEHLLKMAQGRPGLDVTIAQDGSAGMPAPEAPPVDPKRQAIYDLADDGKSALEIAKKTGHPTGEIELILKLRKQTVGRQR